MKQQMTLQELAVELQRRQDAKVDYIAGTGRIHFVTDSGGSEIDLLGEDAIEGQVATGLIVNDTCHGQIAAYAGIPRAYYRRMQSELPALLDENVNRWLRRKDESRMVRTLDGTARAFLSDRYRRIDDFDIAQMVLPILGDIPDVRFESCALTERRMYIKALAPRVAGEVRVGDEVCAGVVIKNSEVGEGSLSVERMVYRLVCLNGMTVGTAMRQVHLGARIQGDDVTRILSREAVAADDQALLLAVRDVVRSAVNEVAFAELLDQMRAATEGETIQHVTQAVKVLSQRESLTESELDGILTHLAAGGDLSRWGLLNAVTRQSQDVEDYDRASELEALGGKVLTYSPHDWEALALAR